MAATAAPARAPHAAPPWLAAATAASCSSTRRATKAVPLRTDASGLDGAACSCSHTAAAAFAAERRWSWSRGGAMRQRPLLPVQAWRSDPAASREMLMLATMLEAADSELLHTQQEEGEEVESHGGEDQESTALAVWARKCVRAAAVPAALVLAASSWQQLPAHATELGGGNPAYGEVGAVLELGVQLIYLGLLLLFLGVGTFLVVRQVLVRRELESAAKELQERVRTGEASSEEYYELGAIFLRKKLYTQANKYLEQAIKKWDGDDQDLAQVYNALGFSCYSDEDVDGAIVQYQKAVKLQPGYVTAWNNLGDALEKKKEYKPALRAYQEALQFDPANKIASARRDALKKRVERFQGIPE